MKANEFLLVYNGDSKWTIGNKGYKIPGNFSEQVLLIGGPKSQDLTNQIAYIEPGLTYLSFPTGEYDNESYSSWSTMTVSLTTTMKYGAFKGLYFNPSPYGLSMANTPNKGNPAYENGRRVMFWETMSLQDSYWEWELRGNHLSTNFAWKSGENCVF